MVFQTAAKKTGGYMLVSAVLGLGIVMFLTEDLGTPSGAVTSGASAVTGSGWLVFVLGLFVGALMIGTYFYLAHVEHGREE